MPRPVSYNLDAALASAMTLFWEKGFHATSLKNLESSLNMKPGSIYAAFSSKVGLYEQAMRYYFESARDGFRSEMLTASSPLDGLADHIRSYANASENHPQRQVCMLMKTIVDTQTTQPGLAQQARDYLSLIRAEIAAVVERAMDQGELPIETNSGRLARRIQANLNALRMELHHSEDSADLSELAEDMAQEIVRMRTGSIEGAHETN